MPFGTLLSVPVGAAGRSWVAFLSMIPACVCFRKLGPCGGDVTHVLLTLVSPFVPFLFHGFALYPYPISVAGYHSELSYPYPQGQQVGILYVLSFAVLIHDKVVFPFLALVCPSFISHCVARIRRCRAVFMLSSCCLHAIFRFERVAYRDLQDQE